MDEWLLRLQLVDEEARVVCAGLLHRHPALLYAEDGPARVTATVQVLLDATRQRQLLRPWFMQDAQILAIVDRCVRAPCKFWWRLWCSARRRCNAGWRAV